MFQIQRYLKQTVFGIKPEAILIYVYVLTYPYLELVACLGSIGQ